MPLERRPLCVQKFWGELVKYLGNPYYLGVYTNGN